MRAPDQVIDAGGQLSADDLVALNRAAMLPRLLAGVTHEINNALLIIDGTAELLESGPAVQAGVTRGAARIRLQTGRIAQAVRELLDFARGEPTFGSRIRLHEAAASAVALRMDAIKRAGLSVSLQSDVAACVIRGSRLLLQQAVLNLLFNAEQALSGNRGAAITVALHRQDEYAVLRVADTGPGISAYDRARIFDFDASRTGARRHRLGLGLAATRRIAEAHGGTLLLEDSACGAAFLLRLPLEIARDD